MRTEVYNLWTLVRTSVVRPTIIACSFHRRVPSTLNLTGLSAHAQNIVRIGPQGPDNAEDERD